MKVTILGCGASGGVPRLGGLWGACDPHEARNRRRRVSVLVETATTTILIDTSPDLREQLLDAGTQKLDAVIFTHSHADHLHGLDDLRAMNRLMGRPIPIYASPATLAEIMQRFAYVFRPAAPNSFYKPTLEPHEITGSFSVGDLIITPFQQDHGFVTTLGFRIGGFAYSTDLVALDDQAFATLTGIDLWIVDCLRYEPHPTHSHLANTLAWIDRLKPERAVLTHMDIEMDYRTLHAELPAGVEPGYDGMSFDIG